MELIAARSSELKSNQLNLRHRCALARQDLRQVDCL